MTRIEEQLRDEEQERISERVSQMNEKEKDIYLEAYKDALKYRDSIDGRVSYRDSPNGRVSLLSMWCPLP